MKLEGILTVTVTPFDSDGRVDLDAYGRIIEFVLSKGVHCIIPCGTTGEYYALSNAERREILRFVKETAGGKTQLLAGANATTTAEVIDLGGYAKELGYEGLMLASPFYSIPTTEELVAHFKAVDAALDMPILLYNFPARTGVDMSPAFLDGVRENTNICAIKESSGSIERLHTLATAYTDQLDLVCGMDDQAIEHFLWGARSWVAGASNFLPAEHVALYDACVRDRDFATGMTLMRRLMPMLSILEQGGKYLQYCKHGCALAGVPVGETRAPLLPLTADEKRRFEAAYEELAAQPALVAAAQ
jgi:4-hydroxy-tetrahydrodipicolinate synthase